MAGCHSCASDQSARRGSRDPALRRILWIALMANTLMFLVEMVASWLSGSVSLAADALDFFGDAANYGISLFVLGMGIAARARATLFKGGTMALFGLYVIGIALWRATTGSVPEADIMGATALLALVVNVGVAMLLFSYRGGDSNMRSVWLCSRNDAIANIAVILAAGGVLATATGWPDILVATIIATLNLSAAWQVIRQARGEIRRVQSAPAP
ncbi:MAG: cation transporter [Candidatus Competibacteraceae bacterium]|nr:cation transporter [Candidatus Competibacteraceae bacterium]